MSDPAPLHLPEGGAPRVALVLLGGVLVMLAVAIQGLAFADAAGRGRWLVLATGSFATGLLCFLAAAALRVRWVVDPARREVALEVPALRLRSSRVPFDAIARVAVDRSPGLLGGWGPTLHLAAGGRVALPHRERAEGPARERAAAVAALLGAEGPGAESP